VFFHPEIEQLYENDMQIGHDTVYSILALPRQTVIADLEKVILDSITRFHRLGEQEWDETKHNFSAHAIFLLTELKAEESLPTILQLLRQDSEYLEYWFGDDMVPILWESIYHLGSNQLPVLASFLKEPNLYYYARLIPSIAVSQIAIHQPERRAEVVAWYTGIFSFFLDHFDDASLIDSDLIGLMVSDVLDFRGAELLPFVGRFFEKGVVPHSFSGDFNEVKKEMESPLSDNFERKLFTIFERYDHILNNWYPYKDDETDESAEDSAIDKLFRRSGDGYDYPDTYMREEPKVGRNDPCPGGSGKKYKKCCMD
jgi:hypothetical protein